MNQYKKQAVTAFEEFAKSSELKSISRSDTFMEIVGRETGLRIRWRVERIEGVFVTLFRLSERDREYSLVYLVEFENGNPKDINLAMSNDAGLLADVARRYGTKYLVGDLDKFIPFETYANRRIAEQSLDLPEIKATKWIRPEW